VRRGLWRLPESPPVIEPEEEPTFHVFASERVERRRREVDYRTVEHWRRALTNHLLPYFTDHRPSQITGRLVDRYKPEKLRERERIDEAHAEVERPHDRGFSPASINKVLAQVLDDAVEDGYLSENPARGKHRRLRTGKPRRTWLELDDVRSLREKHRALIATMIVAGLRVSELTSLRWRDVDLATGSLHVAESKTDAGRRTVEEPPGVTFHHRGVGLRASPGRLYRRRGSRRRLRQPLPPTTSGRGCAPHDSAPSA
jgi:integrase